MIRAAREFEPLVTEIVHFGEEFFGGDVPELTGDNRDVTIFERYNRHGALTSLFLLVMSRRPWRQISLAKTASENERGLVKRDAF